MNWPRITSPTVSRRTRSERYVLIFSYWDINELFDLIPEDWFHSTK